MDGARPSSGPLGTLHIVAAGRRAWLYDYSPIDAGRGFRIIWSAVKEKGRRRARGGARSAVVDGESTCEMLRLDRARRAWILLHRPR